MPKSSVFSSSDQRILFLIVWETLCFLANPTSCTEERLLSGYSAIKPWLLEGLQWTLNVGIQGNISQLKKRWRVYIPCVSWACYQSALCVHVCVFWLQVSGVHPLNGPQGFMGQSLTQASCSLLHSSWPAKPGNLRCFTHTHTRTHTQTRTPPHFQLLLPSRPSEKKSMRAVRRASQTASVVSHVGSAKTQGHSLLVGFHSLDPSW